jgi:hypothetical protein
MILIGNYTVSSAANTIYYYVKILNTVKLLMVCTWACYSDGATSNFHYRQYGGFYKSTGNSNYKYSTSNHHQAI